MGSAVVYVTRFGVPEPDGVEVLDVGEATPLDEFDAELEDTVPLLVDDAAVPGSYFAQLASTASAQALAASVAANDRDPAPPRPLMTPSRCTDLLRCHPNVPRRSAPIDRLFRP